MTTDTLLRIRDVAALLNCSDDTVYRLIHDGKLRDVVVRSRKRIRSSDVQAYIDRNRGSEK